MKLIDHNPSICHLSCDFLCFLTYFYPSGHDAEDISKIILRQPLFVVCVMNQNTYPKPKLR